MGRTHTHTHSHAAFKADRHFCVKMGEQCFPHFDGYLLAPHSIVSTLESWGGKEVCALWKLTLVERELGKQSDTVISPYFKARY